MGGRLERQAGWLFVWQGKAVGLESHLTAALRQRLNEAEAAAG